MGPGANGMSLSSASASLGVSPMPTNTAVGIAASAIALPAGIWSLVSSDFRGAACRGPFLGLRAIASQPCSAV